MDTIAFPATSAPRTDADVALQRPPPLRRVSRRKVVLWSVAILASACGAYYGEYFYRVGRYLESTDDAYVKADFTIVAPKVSGYIATVLVEDNQLVKAGAVVAKIDDRDFRTALEQANADVASA